MVSLTVEDVLGRVPPFLLAARRWPRTKSAGQSGFEAIEIIESHRVHEHAVSSIVRARQPSG